MRSSVMAEATPSFCIRMAKRFAIIADTEERSAYVFTQNQGGVIPVLYQLAREMKIPMTRLVSSLIEKSLKEIERSKFEMTTEN